MPFLLRNIRLELEEPEDALPARVAARLRVPPTAVRAYAIVHRALDARRKDDLHFRYQVEVALDGGEPRERSCVRRLRPAEVAWLRAAPYPAPEEGGEPLVNRPIIVGFGPAGMFAALRLAELGYRPLVLERGQPVRRRHRDILQRYYRFRDFDPESNLLFGEGGAGTYSDGKLYTRVHDPLTKEILVRLYQHGADPDILVNARPHIGSDRLPRICWRLREAIERLGGEVRFGARVEDVRIETDRLAGLRVGDAWWETGPVLLGIGHSARDTYRMLDRRGVRLEARPFQIGVRIEHPQALVDRWQYGAAAGHSRLGPAEYHLVAKGACGDAGDLFSFCMCPGGEILPTNESEGLIATNGASRSRRGGRFANSGLVITVDPRVAGPSALEGLAYQERWERLAYEATGGTYCVPAQRATDFLADRTSDGVLETSFPLGAAWTRLRSILPAEVAEALARGLPMLDGRMPGYAGEDAILTAPETRASAPVRIVRDPTSRVACGVDGLYPIGEGAGYAGGIISAAIDGWRTADAVVARHRRP
ncbi:MAG: hypothetical protein FLDDKLPJ_00603 [Phycisphaerae bacterium]|nr:hypothetical protein [Phycisphaerae bacterium]